MELIAVDHSAKELIEALKKDSEVEFLYNRMVKHDLSLSKHGEDVAERAVKMCYLLGYDDFYIKEIAIGALLHDIGKIYIPEEIIKKPSSLTKEEFKKIMEHPMLGYKTVLDFGFSDIVLDIILHHHEKETGNGYPHKSSYICEETKVVAIADKYEAIKHKRPYSNAHSINESLMRMEMFRECYSNSTPLFEALRMSTLN